jgi:hypothetical protein
VTLFGPRILKPALQRPMAALSTVAITVATAAALRLGGATPAFAGTTPDCIGPHCYSYTQINTYGEAPFIGGHVSMPLS